MTIASKPSDTSATRHRVIVDFNVPARMRDGTTLYANVFRPEGEGPWPVLLTRLPYSKDSPTLNVLDAVQVARSGFLVVFQDTRGSFTSEGECVPFKFERQDGFDSVEWAAKLPGSNGRVVMFGSSYFGNTQWNAAFDQPPSLAGIAPRATWSDPLEGLFERGGAFELGLDMVWSLIQGPGHLLRSPLSHTERMARIRLLASGVD